MQPVHSSRHFIRALITAALLLLCGAVPPRSAAAQTVGAMLYEKHCIGCHPDGTKLKLADSLLETLRNPPRRMPVFDEDTLTSAEAQAIGEYIRPGYYQPERKAPVRDKPAKEKKSWMKGFGTSDL